MKKCFVVTLCAAGSASLTSQVLPGVQQFNGTAINVITTAVPFLLIGPDSRQGAMGDAGAATEPDVYAIHWNGSKLAFAEKDFGAGATVTPWLRRVMPGINMYYITGYGKLNQRNVIASSLRYFDLGTISPGIGMYTVRELAIDIAYAHKLTANFSLGMATRYIYSGISRLLFSRATRNAAGTFAADLSIYYRSDKFTIGNSNGIATFGLALTNLGGKIPYSNGNNFIPMNMRLGGGLKTIFSERHSLGVYLDYNKLLVPTPPVYKFKTDSSGNMTPEPETDPLTGRKVIAGGKDPDVPVHVAIFQSFADAPGGISEELQEISVATGLEYSYRNIVARGGYFFEPRSKGGRQFFTAGAGLRFKLVCLDGSYLMPTTLSHPLQGTWRVSIMVGFSSRRKSVPQEMTP